MFSEVMAHHTLQMQQEKITLTCSIKGPALTQQNHVHSAYRQVTVSISEYSETKIQPAWRHMVTVFW